MISKIKKYPILFLKLIFLSPLILIFLLINIFTNLKIARIETKLFGHFVPQLEIFICEKLDGRYRNTIIIWFTDRKICNHYILKKFSKNLVILPRQILEPIHVFFSLFSFKNKFIYFYYDDKSKKPTEYAKKVDEFSLFLKYPSSINFTNDEVQKGKTIFQEMDFDDTTKYICFASRTNHFRNEIVKSTRNSDINRLKKSINFLTSKNYKAVRLGKDNLSNITWENNDIIDISSKKFKSDFSDLFLMSKCQFFLTDQSGISFLGSLLRKNRLIINYYNFNLLHHESLDYMPIILPKKFYSKKENSFLSYRQVFEKKLLSHGNLESLSKVGYELIDNSSEEIEEAVKNMYLYNEDRLSLKESRVNQKDFWNVHFDFFRIDTKRIIICPSFFKENIKLFK